MRINDFLKQNKLVISNFKYLTIINYLNILLPLLTYPYLIKTLGTENYGGVIYVQGVIGFLAIFVNYGFELSGVKSIAENKTNKRELANIVSNILAVKSILVIFSCFFYIVFVCIFSSDPLLYICFIGVLVYFAYFPVWYYQGIEKIKHLALMNLALKLVNLILIFSLVTDMGDKYKLGIIYSLSNILIALLGLFFLVYIEKLKITSVTLTSIKKCFLDGFDFFYSNVFVSIKDRFNILIVGYFFPNTYVIVYDLAMKINTVLSIPIGTLNNVSFPKMVREKSVSLLFKLLLACFVYSIFSSFLIFLLLYSFDLSVIDMSNDNKLYIYPLLVVPIILSISQTLVRNYLNAFDYRKEYLRTITFTTLWYFFTIIIFWFLPNKEFYWFIVVIMSTYVFECFIRIYYSVTNYYERKKIRA
ncbi:oligosaccharide flippase family protein [Vibrio splendidus]|uniref:oligosaccharide flippase family protein n=1 Tax=Vibrio splendidus TaxID=29497 RepID=UPI00352EE286